MQMPTLPELTVGTAAHTGNVTALPVFATLALPRADYALGLDAVAAGQIEICELPNGATVAQLQACNRGPRRVLLLEGDHLIGARQNRMLTSSVLIGGRRKLALPVSCVEQGRWQERAPRFATSLTIGSPRLRRIVKHSVTRALFATGRRSADQDQIWHQVSSQQQALHVRSATASLAHTYAARAGDLASVADQLPYPDGAIGVALGIGSELISIDLFDQPETCRRYWRRLVEGAALEGLGVQGSARLAGSEVRGVLAALRRADWSRFAAVGDGDELRTSTPSATGSLLVIDGRVVHFGVACGAADEPRRAALDSRPAVMRYDLPAALAARYRITSRLGVGGTKEVFRAVDGHGGPDVAIARMPAVDREVFEAEIALARRVQSAHVPRILDAQVDDDGDGYLVMERCDGPSLAQLAVGRALPVADAAPILVAFARGLCAIHAVHVLHRDVKLENVMLCSGDHGPTLKILDFGLSARARSVTTAVGVIGGIAGTLPYMAREVLRGERLDARSDVYAFAVCCYRLLTGGFPTPPRDDENQFEYLERLRDTPADASRLPAALPATVRALLARMLDPDRAHRPFMPEVVAAFEHAFGTAAIADPSRETSAARAPVMPPLRRVAQLAIPVARPEQLLVGGSPDTPLVALVCDGMQTEVRALDRDGRLRWARVLDGRLVSGLRADLDGDDVRELYLAGPGRVAALAADGRQRFNRATATATTPSLLALPDLARPALVLDGETLDVRTGASLGALAFAYTGDGRQLVTARDPRGLAYHGGALQGFCGDHGTGAAIVNHPGDTRFVVAHLEETRSGRIQVGVYGPGGARLHHLTVAEHTLDTGDVSAISRVYDRRAPLFGPAHAPIALLGDDGRAVVIVPLLDPAPRPAPAIPATLVAFELPSGRELWRWQASAPGGRALLADVHGDRRPQLVVGTGQQLVIHDPWTGLASAPVACTGVPVAFGDPFGTGFAHVITASPDGVELWRGPRCAPGAMAWTGPRGDLWRTGTLRSDGTPFGPV